MAPGEEQLSPLVCLVRPLTGLVRPLNSIAAGLTVLVDLKSL